MRRRDGDSWELRVYAGVDPTTGRQRYATRTVHGSWRTATRALAELVAEVDDQRMHAGTVGDLLERWLATASPGWAVTTVEIDQLYARLLALRWRDIDLHHGAVAFTRALVVAPDGPALAPTKTDRTHQVDLDADTLTIVHATHARAADRAAAAGVRLSDAFVFTHDDCQRLHSRHPRMGPAGGRDAGADPGQRQPPVLAVAMATSTSG